MHAYIEKLSSEMVFLSLSFSAHARQTDTARKRAVNFGGALSVTNNGFLLIPDSTLGKPAAIATIYGGGDRCSFEAEFRYSLDGKPRSFIVIWRYKLIRKDKFQFTLGTHFAALNFISTSVIRNGVEKEAIHARLFFPVIELPTAWVVSKNITAGIYYQHGRALEKELAGNTNFISLRSNFSNIAFNKKNLHAV